MRSSKDIGLAASSRVKAGRSLKKDSLIATSIPHRWGFCQVCARESLGKKTGKFAPAHAEKEESQGSEAEEDSARTRPPLRGTAGPPASGGTPPQQPRGNASHTRCFCKPPATPHAPLAKHAHTRLRAQKSAALRRQRARVLRAHVPRVRGSDVAAAALDKRRSLCFFGGALGGQSGGGFRPATRSARHRSTRHEQAGEAGPSGD